MLSTTSTGSTTTVVDNAIDETNKIGNNEQPEEQIKTNTDNDATAIASKANSMTDAKMVDSSVIVHNEIEVTSPPSTTKSLMDEYRPMPLPPPITAASNSNDVLLSSSEIAATTSDNATTVISNASEMDIDNGISEHQTNEDMIIDNADQESTVVNIDTNKNVDNGISPLTNTNDDTKKQNLNDSSMIKEPTALKVSTESTINPIETKDVGNGTLSTVEKNDNVTLDPTPSMDLPQLSHTGATATMQQSSSKSIGSQDALQQAPAVIEEKKDINSGPQVEDVQGPSPNDIAMSETTNNQDREANVEYLLPDEEFYKYYKREEQIKYIQQNLLSTKRLPTKNKKSGSTSGTIAPTSMIMANKRVQSTATDTKVEVDAPTIASDDMTWYYEKQSQVNAYSKILVQNFIRARQAFWFEYKKLKHELMLSSIQKVKPPSRLVSSEDGVVFRSVLTPHNSGIRGFGSIVSDEEDSNPSVCGSNNNESRNWPHQGCATKIQCLECSYSGYLVTDIPDNDCTNLMNLSNENKSIQYHFLRTNHKFGM
jgi:hypothetical protein